MACVAAGWPARLWPSRATDEPVAGDAAGACGDWRGGRRLPTHAHYHEAANHAVDLVITSIADKPERAN